jgi:hypothetical protein
MNWKERGRKSVATFFELTRHFPETTEESHEESQSGQSLGPIGNCRNNNSTRSHCVFRQTVLQEAVMVVVKHAAMNSLLRPRNSKYVQAEIGNGLFPGTVIVFRGSLKAGSHIACRAHAAPMPFPWHGVPLRV